jgi:hypothetical protein
MRPAKSTRLSHAAKIEQAASQETTPSAIARVLLAIPGSTVAIINPSLIKSLPF